MRNFIPSSDAQLVRWTINYKAKLILNGAALGLTAGEIAAATALCDDIGVVVGANAAAKTSYKSSLAAKKKVIGTNVGALRSFIKDIKRKPGYSNSIGAGMGIVGNITPLDTSNYQSSLKVEIHPGYVGIKFTKKGVQGVNLYTRKNGDLNWEKLGFYGHSPCRDTRPLAVDGQPESRQYYCVGVMKDQQIGLKSNIATVAFSG